MNAAELNLPTDLEAKTARVAAEALRGLDHGSKNAHVRVSRDGREAVDVTLPPEAMRLLLRTLLHIANGDAVAVLPVRAELTTQETADFLNVSRPHVIKLLDEGAIAYRKVGTHRRVSLPDLVEYQRQDKARRRVLLDDLTREAQELGLDY